jgi:hypothetical protein
MLSECDSYAGQGSASLQKIEKNYSKGGFRIVTATIEKINIPVSATVRVTVTK